MTILEWQLTRIKGWQNATRAHWYFETKSLACYNIPSLVKKSVPCEFKHMCSMRGVVSQIFYLVSPSASSENTWQMSSVIPDMSVYKHAPSCFQALKMAENSKFDVKYLSNCCEPDFSCLLCKSERSKSCKPDKRVINSTVWHSGSDIFCHKCQKTLPLKYEKISIIIF